MIQLLGFKDNKFLGYVYKLQKVIYGLKQAPRAWFDTLKGTLLTMQLTHAKANVFLFLKLSSSSKVYLFVFSDDIILSGSDEKEVKALIFVLNNKFALKYLGLLI